MKRPRKFKIIGAKPAGPSEHRIQTALMDYLRLALRPGLKVAAIPNGGYRHPSVANKLMNEGVQRGTPDLFVCLPEGKIAWLEMKTPKGSLSPHQKAFRDTVTALGHPYAVARSVDEALDHLTKWDALKPAFRKQSTLFKTDHLESIKLSKGEVSHGTQA